MSSEDSEPEQQPESTADKLLKKECITKWTNEQMELRKQLKLYDTLEWQMNKKLFDSESSDSLEDRDKYLRYVGGMDISFVKNDNLACSGLFVFDLHENMKLVYEDLDTEPILMNQPYVPGFLAYREAPFLLDKLAKLKKNKPHFYPQCLFIDGNGILHINKFGMACHIGLLTDTPAIGVSKKLYQVFGLENNSAHKERISKELRKAGDYFELRSNEENKELLAYCYRSTNESKNPIYVSIGHKISWETCLWILKLVIKKRIPEPIRQADFLTREYLRARKLI
jgi:deoxyinosine 3'endonuclease (endonuclease V)